MHPNSPSLLYVSPVLPSLTGNGLAMRAGMVLEALAACFRVSLLVAPIYGSADGSTDLPEHFAQLCEESVILHSGATPEAAELAFGGRAFDVVHVFRMAAIPFARPFLQHKDQPRQRHLDLDDVESSVDRQIQALRGAVDAVDLARNRIVESALLRLFDRVYVCSEADRLELAGRCKSEIVVLPNAVRPPLDPRRRTRSGELQLLFVATFGYYPNEDAAAYFCTKILPELRPACSVPVRVNLVGGGVSPTLRALANHYGVCVAGRVPAVDPWYESADAAIVPIRAGGGTRIKILEAFGFGVPVVTTSVGVQGLEAQDDQHVLVADTAEAFSRQCLRVRDEPVMAAALSAAAKQLLQERYTLAAINRIVADQFHFAPGALV
jgi:glycosyltransferase involved in cell wall biosynthesis